MGLLYKLTGQTNKLNINYPKNCIKLNRLLLTTFAFENASFQM